MSSIQYSDRYTDDTYEYRHVTLSNSAMLSCKKRKLLSESEWRALGIQQSRGWCHYAIYKPEPNILLFRRPIGTDPLTGKPPSESSSSSAAVAKQTDVANPIPAEVAAAGETAEISDSISDEIVEA